MVGNNALMMNCNCFQYIYFFGNNLIYICKINTGTGIAKKEDFKSHQVFFNSLKIYVKIKFVNFYNLRYKRGG